jgi:uncharacterized protein (TIGR02466 family)
MNKPYIHQLFPSTIYSVLDEEMAKKMLPIAKKYLDDKSLLTYQWNYKNTYKPDNGLEVYDDMKEFTNYVLERAAEYDDIQGYHRYNLKITIFASEMFNGDAHGIHSHPNCIYSGLMYLQVPENSSPIMFVDPRNHTKFILPKVKELNQFSSPVVNIIPAAGLFMMWSSWLEHMVPPSQNTEEGRITLVFNLYNTI